jgi:hypothetical protein
MCPIDCVILDCLHKALNLNFERQRSSAIES